MSWTSEHEPPPPRPNLETDDPADLGFEVVETTDADEGGEGNEPLDIPDEGPLDPSVFDGLFDDLGDPDLDPPAVVGPAPEEPTGPIGIVALDLADIDRGPDPEPGPGIDLADPDLDRPPAFDDTDGGSALVPEPPSITPADDRPIDEGPLLMGRSTSDTASPADQHPTSGQAIDPMQEIGPAGISAFEPVDLDPREAVDPGAIDPAALGISTTMPEVDVPREGPDGVGDDRAALLDHGPAGRTNDIYHEPEVPHPVPLIDPDPPISSPVIQRDPAQPVSSPAIQPDPPPSGVTELRVAEPGEPTELPVVRPSVDDPHRTRSRWRSFALATTVGVIFGVGGAFVLAQIIDRDTPTIDAATPDQPADLASEATAGDPAADENEPAGPIATVDGSLDLGPIDRLELGTLRFEPGTDRLTEESDEALGLLAQAIDQRVAPIAVTVRTYTEATPSDDLALSELQADALVRQLVELQADPDQLVAIGLGRSLLTTAQPVPNFVVASAGLETSPLRTTLKDISPFAIGLDSVTAQLRPESRLSLGRIAAAMAADAEGRSVTLSAYSFGEVDAESNRVVARAAAQAAADHLTSVYGIEGSRVKILVLGEAPYGVTTEVGGHVGLRWGDLAAGSVAMGAVPVDEIDFDPGSTALSETNTAILDQLLDAMVGTELAVVVDVHSFDGADDEANYQLSQDRALAVADYLMEAGLPASRLRAYGRGDRPQFRSENRVARIVVSFVPWAG